VLAERGIPTVMTLHEYWWLCPRAGLMYDLEGRACETATPVDCARCVDIYPIDRQKWSDDRFENSHAELGDRRWFARALEGRAADMAAAVAHVDRFIAPSHFLAERFLSAGFPADKVVVSDYGFPPAPVIPPRPLRRPIRFGFVGTLSDYKGVEVFARAVAATGRSSDELVASIHGHLDWFPEVAAELRQLADDCPLLELAGPFDPSRRDRVLGALDVLVVPSLWWENSPLTIHEAHQRGIPVLASDRGGMAELLAAGGGHTFPPGDADALAALICELVDEPEQIEILRRAIPPVKPIEDDVKLLEELHAEILAAR
jgi:glycosyltransferase involved in cell wall biosynthesis